MNEAALNAARYNQKVVRMLDFEFAKDKVMMGSERRSMIITDEEKKVTAVHEAGHALLAVLLPHADPVHKVTIIPRGMALGVTMQLPVEDKHNYTRDYLNDQIAILLGGRIAEEITMNGMTTGAGNDLERSTELARKMVCEWGMSDAMGPLTFGKKEEQIFLGREIAQHQDYSEDTAIRIDHEIKRFVTTNYERAQGAARRAQAGARPRSPRSCSSREVLDAEQVRRIVAGEALEEHKPRNVAAGDRRRLEAAGQGTAVDRAAAAAAQQAAAAGISQSETRAHSGVWRSSQSSSSTHRGLPLSCRTMIPAPLLHVPLPGGAPLAARRAHARHGHPQRHARLVRRRRRCTSTPTRAVDDGLRMVARRRGHPRRRRRIDAARRRAAARGRGAAARAAGHRAAGAPAGVPISIDTYKARVAREAVARGAAIVNDISGLQYDRELGRASWPRPARRVVLMHNRGRSRDMYREAVYDDVRRRDRRGAAARRSRGRSTPGVARDAIIVDPGTRLRQAGRAHLRGAGAASTRLAALDRPILCGSVAQVVPDGGDRAERAPAEREWGTAAAVTASVLLGAHIVRVHGVARDGGRRPRRRPDSERVGRTRRDVRPSLTR